MTGWGQSGPLAQAAGHDLDYVALTGVLALSSRPGERPIVPPTVVGDASGALGLAFGIVCALMDVRNGGPGRVLDAAITDVVGMLSTLVHWGRTRGLVASDQPGIFRDSPFYDVYACADGRHVSVAAIESQFYALLLRLLGLDDVDPSRQMDRSQWPSLKARISQVIRSQPRAHWCFLMEGSDACFAPVLDLEEAAQHPHNRFRAAQGDPPHPSSAPAIAPRFLPLTAGATHHRAGTASPFEIISRGVTP